MAGVYRCSSDHQLATESVLVVCDSDRNEAKKKLECEISSYCETSYQSWSSNSKRHPCFHVFHREVIGKSSDKHNTHGTVMACPCKMSEKAMQLCSSSEGIFLTEILLFPYSTHSEDSEIHSYPKSVPYSTLHLKESDYAY